MSRQIIKQPNKLYAIYDTVYDELIYKDITIKEYIKIKIKEESLRIKRDINEIAEKLNKGEKPYYQFTLTYKEALKMEKEAHGK